MGSKTMSTFSIVVKWNMLPEPFTNKFSLSPSSECRRSASRILANETGSRRWSEERRFSHLRVGSINKSTLRLLRHITRWKLLWEFSSKLIWSLVYLIILQRCLFTELPNKSWGKKKLGQNRSHELSLQWTSLAKNQRWLHWKGCEWSKSVFQRWWKHWRWWTRYWNRCFQVTYAIRDQRFRL